MQSNCKNNSGITTRNGARKAKIQTRAMASGTKPSAALVAAKKKAQMKKKHIVDTVLRDHYQTAMDSRSGERGQTVFVTDPKMLEHKCLWDENYPECPERLSSVLKRCEDLGLLNCCQQIPSRLATREELNMLHASSVYDILEKTCTSDDKTLEEVSSQYDAVFIHPTTNEVAQLAAGSTIDLVDMIVNRKAQNGIALVRPPGHHAMHAEPCGYCFYNNAALAAKHAVTNLNVGRVLIVDWDVHHGQGTQQMFYDDNRVLYFSVHRYEHGSFWPNLKQSNWNYVGCGRGKGYNVNVPLNKTKMQDSDYLAIWHQLLMPIALEYQPELVLISAGYDAAVGCPEFSPDLVICSAGFDSALGDEKGEMEVTPACYAHLTHKLMGICPNVCVVLEGGYCLRSLAEGVAMTLRSLLGKPAPNLQPLTTPSDSIKDTILNCIYAHKPYWKCFNMQQTYNIDKTIPNISDAAKIKHKVELKWLGDETTPAFYETRNCYPVQPTDVRNEIQAKLNNLELLTKLHSPQHAVCYIYDEAMLKHQNICEPDHVERPERIKKIHERHKEFGLLSRVHMIDSRTATEEEIRLVHTQAYINLLKEIQSTKLRDLNLQKETYNSVYFHPESFQCAKIAVGCVLQMVDTVMNGVGGSGVCVVRPPGHHAEEDLPSGFCLINNAAVAAKYALQNHSLKRILLLDWDVHHGNGTQHIFEEDPRVLYVSLHRYDNGTFFPNSKDADYTRVGKGKGQGYNVNIPWNKRGMGDAEYLAAFTQVILPIAYEYSPELVIVSAGFDACVGDPLGGCKVSPECYGRFTHWLRGLALGRVILCLEGGYNVNSISYAMTMCTKALLGDPIQHFYDPKGHCQQSAIESINNVISVHKKYWTSLKFQEAIPIERILPEPEPSRGLVINESSELSTSMEINNSATSSLNDSTKSGMCHSSFRDSIERKPDDSLEDSMKDLTINSYKTCEGNSIASDEIDISFASSANRSSMPDKSKLNSSQKSDSFSIGCKDGNCGSDEENKAETSGSKKSKKKSSLTEAGSSREKRVTRSSSRQQQANEAGTLVDYLAENMQAIVNEEMFAVIPMPWCPHLENLYSVPPDQRFSQDSKCVDCDHVGENWVCLHCYMVACARSINGHMQAHCQQSSHHLLLSLTDLSVWCNTCDAYVDNALLYEPKNIAHIAKFGEPMPWCYGDSNNTITMQ